MKKHYIYFCLFIITLSSCHVEKTSNVKSRNVEGKTYFIKTDLENTRVDLGFINMTKFNLDITINGFSNKIYTSVSRPSLCERLNISDFNYIKIDSFDLNITSFDSISSAKFLLHLNVDNTSKTLAMPITNSNSAWHF